MTSIDFLNKVHKILDSQEYNLSYSTAYNSWWPVDEAQLLIEQATDEVAIAVQHIILGLGWRIREAIFLRVQAFMYLVQKVY